MVMRTDPKVAQAFRAYQAAQAAHASQLSQVSQRFQEQKRLSLLGAVISPAVMAVLLFVLGDRGAAYFHRAGVSYLDWIYTGLPVVLLGFSVLALTMLYLQTGFRRLPPATGADVLGEGRVDEEAFGSFKQTMLAAVARLDERLDLIKAAHDAAQDELNELKNRDQLTETLDVGDRAELISGLKTELESQAASEVLDRIKSEVAIFIKRESRDSDIRVMFSQSKERLSNELLALGFRGNLNLTIGVGTTGVGLWLLWLTVSKELEGPLGPDPWTALAAHFLPRLSLVVLIELFAYFFLSLYKTTLGEIKYFQNELTNVEAKQIALHTAIDQADKGMVTASVNALSATERNHILNKDQTTVDLEKAKLERQGTGDIVKALSELLKKAER
jgi:hypothetical protein